MTSKSRRTVRRVAISAETLDDILTQALHRVPGFEAVDVSAGYRLSDPDADGCNWSGRVVALKKAAKSLMEKRGAKAEKRNQKKWAKS